MTTDETLSDHLRGLPERVLSARLGSSDWVAVALAISALRSALARGTVREVRREASVFNDLVPVRMRAEPGTQPVDAVPDNVVRLVHDLEVDIHDWIPGGDGAETDDRQA